MPDVTFDTANKLSRSRRGGGGGQIDTGRVTTRSQDFAREVSEGRVGAGVAGGLSGLAEGFNSFFKFAVQRKQEEDRVTLEKDIADINKRKMEELARVQDLVRRNPELVKRAIATRTEEQLIDPEFRGSKTVIFGLKQAIGQEQFVADKLELQEALRNMPPDANPDDFARELINEQTKDLDPLVAITYRQASEKMVAKEVSDFRTTRIAREQEAAVQRGVALVDHAIASGEFAGNDADQFQNMILGLAMTLPTGTLQATAQAEQLVFGRVIRHAADGDWQAMKALDQPLPWKDGLSLRQMYPDAVAEAEAAGVIRARQVRTIAQEQAYNDFEARLSAAGAGQIEPGVNDVLTLGKEMMQLKEQYGDMATRYRTLRNSYFDLIGKNAKQNVVGAQAVAGVIPTGSDSEYQKWLEYTATPDGLTNEAHRLGVTEDKVAQARVFAIAGRGVPGQLKDNMSNTLMSGGPEDIGAVVNFLVPAVEGSNRDLSNFVNKEAEPYLALAMAANEAGEDPSQALADFQNIRKENPELNPATALEDEMIKSSSGDRMVQRGAGGAREVTKDMFDDADIPALMHEGVFGPRKVSWDKVPQTIQGDMQRMANFAHAMANGDEAKRLRIFEKLVSNRYSFNMRADGQLWVTRNRAPVAVHTAEGIRPGKPVDTDTFDQYDAYKNVYNESDQIGIHGKAGGLVQDDGFEQGHGLAFEAVMDDGTTGVPTLNPDVHMTVPMDQIPQSLVDAGLYEVVDIVGVTNEQGQLVDGARIRAVRPGPDDPDTIMIDDHQAWKYNPNTDTWTRRFFEQGAHVPTPEEIEERRKTRQQSEREQFEAAKRRGPGLVAGAGLDIPDLGRKPRKEKDVGAMATVLGAGLISGSGLGVAESIGHVPGYYGPIGSPAVQGPTDRGPVSKAELQAHDKLVRSFLQEGAKSGFFTDDVPNEIGVEGRTAEEALDAARDRTIDGGKFLEDRKTPAGARSFDRMTKFIETFEGRREFAYDDRNGKRITPGAKVKGDPTIGVGFNLTRPDADFLLRQVGADPQAVKEGRQGLTDAQIDKLLELSLQASINFLREEFNGIPMPEHRWTALVSLTMNSRWKDGRPTLIGPRLTAAIKEGRWEDAELEIRERSQGGVTAAQLPGITKRRMHEADMFIGAPRIS